MSDRSGDARHVGALDGLRALCVVLTVVAHIDGLPFATNGNLGVDIFFALSGWLITWLLLGEQADRGRIDLVAFYTRRTFRILPLYLLTVACYALAATATLLLHGDGSRMTAFADALPYLLAMSGEYQTSADPAFYHSWTLGIEEKFYLLWPAIAAALLPRLRLAAIAAALVAALIVAAVPVESVVRGYLGLGFGATWAVTLRRYPAVAALFGRVAIAPACLAGIAAIYLMSLGTIAWIGWNLATSAIGSILVASLWCNRGQAAGRLLARPPLVALGRLTYAIYLIHELVRDAVRAAGVADPVAQLLLTYTLSVLAAAVLNRLVEQPLIDLGRSLARRRRTPAALPA